jgi:hypothetical protein
MLRSFLFIATLLATASVARAQTIRGTVTDEVTGRPIAGAAIFLTGVDGAVRIVTRSRPDGRYELRSAAGDTIRVQVERAGYESLATSPWMLAQESTLEMDLKLKPGSVMLDTLTVIGAWRTRNQAGFERRSRSEATGTFLDAARLTRARFGRTSQRLMALLPGVIADPDGALRLRQGGVASCRPRLYIDGTRYPSDLPIDALVQGDAIRAIELYRNGFLAPAQFSAGEDVVVTSGGRPVGGPPCAIIVIWTELGFTSVGS